MDALTIHEAAETTGWSARMRRYVEQLGLVEPRRSGPGYRLYGPQELQLVPPSRAVLRDAGRRPVRSFGIAPDEAQPTRMRFRVLLMQGGGKAFAPVSEFEGQLALTL